MKIKNMKRIPIILMMLCASVFILTACGEDDFSWYMQGEPNLRSSVDAELSILSCEAEASVQYEGDVAKITVDYYAMTQDEINEAETEKCTKRCEAIMQEAIDQYKEDTGRTASVEVTIYGHGADKQ